MAIGEAEVQRQVGGRGVFAVVRLDVVLGGPRLHFALSVDDSVLRDPGAAQYVAAVTTGTRYAWEKVDRFALETGVAVRVLDVLPLAVDTTEITMVYAAALAMWDGMKLRPAVPVEIEAETQSLRFPI